MAKAQPSYTLQEQYAKLDTDLPSNMSTINLLKYRLLMSCSANGNIDAAKNRLLNLIQDTEISTLFSSLLEAPEEEQTEGIKSLQDIHTIFKANYGYYEQATKELALMGLPRRTVDVLNAYFFANEDPLYKLSIMASLVMFGYIKDDDVNSRKN
jgi:hypothetical protein